MSKREDDDPQLEAVLQGAQEACAAAVRDLRAVGERLSAAIAGVPEPPDEVLDGTAPRTVAAEVRGAVECFVNDDLLEAVAHLEKAARVTAEELVREWEEKWRAAAEGAGSHCGNPPFRVG